MVTARPGFVFYEGREHKVVRVQTDDCGSVSVRLEGVPLPVPIELVSAVRPSDSSQAGLGPPDIS